MPQDHQPITDTRHAEADQLIKSRSFWYHKVELLPGLWTPGYADTPVLLDRLHLPKRFDSKTVLDIGAAEGFFSFDAERRGGQVTAIDRLTAEASGFGDVRRFIGSKAEHHYASVYDLNPVDFGTFDVVLFLGVFYHLRYPLLALDILREICTELLVVETQVCDLHWTLPGGKPTHLRRLSPILEECPLAQFYPGTELNNDITNWWAPNIVGMLTMLSSAGFVPELKSAVGGRAVFHCRLEDKPTLSSEWAAEEFKSLKRPRVSPKRVGQP